ncbi:hypothetical protein E2C01_024733 [Portunus trituberculatus]|uniref:Uncharacterized protein n=1 Tax=Portunus trituberculatus TaxID=210409 RepID=A0A5B7EFY4_PORTR|nr:hypothetical protein [Portunus trituberculatus]
MHASMCTKENPGGRPPAPQGLTPIQSPREGLPHPSRPCHASLTGDGDGKGPTHAPSPPPLPTKAGWSPPTCGFAGRRLVSPPQPPPHSYSVVKLRDAAEPLPSHIENVDLDVTIQSKQRYCIQQDSPRTNQRLLALSHPNSGHRRRCDRLCNGSL